ncbi:MAG: UDP-N-acetylmuramoyl-L-alanine--D-glutamate ligase [Selenomonadaceae bacterium]|nr:UDP-N-acetylmuramoyl-L-alanine--D-glutamate ligase [Selenomonadaceae bacterium]
MELKEKKVLVIGAGISGFAATKIAKKLGADVTLSDAKEETDFIKAKVPKEREKNTPSDLPANSLPPTTFPLFDELRGLGINLIFGKQEEKLLKGVDLVIVSPAVPLRIPILQAALNKKIPVISEVEFAFNLAKSPICAVTGTNGKTTTVTLLGLLLASQYEKVGVGGNIGVALSEVALEVGEGGYIAAEISSYQMEATNNFKPHISAILNVTPDHLKRHGTMEVYQAMKEKIFAQETADDFLVLNYDDEKVREIKDRAGCKVIYFSRKEILDEGAFVDNGKLIIKFDEQTFKLCTIEELGIKGWHNVENALAASMTAFLAGVTAENISGVLKTFQGVEHRIEFVREIDGIKYYNDSKATNTDSTIKALETFDGHINLIAGGDDKLTDLTDFLKLVNQRVDNLILVGDAAKRFREEALKSGFNADRIFKAGYSMENAIDIAKKISIPPQIVLLSPACASFDMYNNFEERGKNFKTIVNAL